MLSSKLNTATLAIFAICIIAPIAHAAITADPSLKIPETLSKGQGAIFVVGDADSIAISATHQAPEAIATCHGTIDEKSQTYEAPCSCSTESQQQIFHAQCTNVKGSAAIVFHKSGDPGNTVDVQAVDGMYASFSQNVPLKQGTMSSTQDGTMVVLSCGNDQSSQSSPSSPSDPTSQSLQDSN
ncbi:uncharacterized protein FA14DRAFT_179312 [Meira miltonrushii]|uniref:Uncharacterized protein n=1 Tax=Meira miltonrushii TaxID=1280837 RepID=A0A316VKB5_9BASI|nr:uncharacterized protein FA14DRAFT_179312 [Meira miltonrushii]PWN35945.1 hypothetical protein FA14DRAFT_179312 [Meira miltonrushii]